MAKVCMLTTTDNPFDPFDQFIQWFMYDIEKGYYSCSRLARLVQIEDEMTEQEVDAEIERAIDELIKLDFTDKYKKVERNEIQNDNDA